MPFTATPTEYVSSSDKEYENKDVYAFHVDNKTGDVILHYNSLGIRDTVRILFTDWESFARTIKEEHEAMLRHAKEEHDARQKR